MQFIPVTALEKASLWPAQDYDLGNGQKVRIYAKGDYFTFGPVVELSTFQQWFSNLGRVDGAEDSDGHMEVETTTTAPEAQVPPVLPVQPEVQQAPQLSPVHEVAMHVEPAVTEATIETLLDTAPVPAEAIPPPSQPVPIQVEPAPIFTTIDDPPNPEPPLEAPTNGAQAPEPPVVEETPADTMEDISAFDLLDSVFDDLN